MLVNIPYMVVHPTVFHFRGVMKHLLSKLGDGALSIYTMGWLQGNVAGNPVDISHKKMMFSWVSSIFSYFFLQIVDQFTVPRSFFSKMAYQRPPLSTAQVLLSSQRSCSWVHVPAMNSHDLWRMSSLCGLEFDETCWDDGHGFREVRDQKAVGLHSFKRHSN